jgi:hypothetical protein
LVDRHGCAGMAAAALARSSLQQTVDASWAAYPVMA